MLDCVVSRTPSPSTSSPDDEECSFSPFSKREYLLAQMRQNDELIDSLLKQVRLSYALLTNIGTYVDYSRISQLHNPYLATPLSIQAYRNAISSSDQHRQTVIAWLDRLQSSVRSPVRAPSATNPFQLDACAAKPVVSLMSRTKIRHLTGTRSHAVLASSGSEDAPVSPNTLAESDIDPYPDDAVPPLGLLASLAISSSRDTTSHQRGHGQDSQNECGGR
jgi:hypothetical protein